MTQDFEAKHVFGLQNLYSVSQLSFEDVSFLFSWAKKFSLMSIQDLAEASFLRGEIISSLFFENSTRTYLSFAIAARKLSAEIFSLDIASSSLTKGEDLIDTARNMYALGCSVLVVRHFEAGIAKKLAAAVNMGIVNAGDGENEHPTQALLDAFTLWQHFYSPQREMLNGLRIAIVGDIKHSRVAKSNMELLPMLGAKVVISGPPSFMVSDVSSYQVKYVDSIEQAICDADVVMMLRVQQERMTKTDLPNQKDYFAQFGLSMSRFLQMPPHAVVMHPGPTNPGMEIAKEVAEHPRSLILEQARNGVFMRMAILYGLITARKSAGLMQ